MFISTDYVFWFQFLDESSSELKPNHVFDLFGVLDMKEFYEEGTSEK